MRNESLDYALRVTSEAGFVKVDLWGNMPHFSINESEYNIQNLIELCNKYGIRVANIGTYCGRKFSSDSKDEIVQEIKDTKKTIDIAYNLGARSIRVVPGNGELSTIDKIVPFFRECADYAEAKNIYMGFENHGGPISGNPDACVELSEKVGSRHFGVLYEPCNLMHAGVDYKMAFSKFSKFITHCHIKDGATQQDGKFRSTMLGEGIIDIKWIVENMNNSGYEGDFALEYEVTDIEPIQTGLKKWFEYFKQI